MNFSDNNQVDGAAKGFLHSWCGKHVLGEFPVYIQLPSPQKPGCPSFKFQAQIGDIALGGVVAIGQSRSIKFAKSIAAMLLCKELIKAGFMTQMEYNQKKPDSANKMAIQLKNGSNDGNWTSAVDSGAKKEKPKVSPSNNQAAAGTSNIGATNDGGLKIECVYSLQNGQTSKTSVEPDRPIINGQQSSDIQPSEISISPSSVSVDLLKRKTLTEARPDIAGVTKKRKALSEEPSTKDGSPSNAGPPTKKLRLSPSKEEGEDSDDDIQIIKEVKKSTGRGSGEKATLASEQNGSPSGSSSAISVSSETTAAVEQDPSNVEDQPESTMPAQSTTNLMTSTGPVAFQDKNATWERVSADIWEHYNRNKQPHRIFEWKMQILKEVSAGINRYIRTPYHLFPVGSTINGLGSYNCDMDLCLVIFGYDRYGRAMVNDNPQFAKRSLYATRAALVDLPNIEDLQVIPATVPIVRFAYSDGTGSVEIDINCNNLPGIRNSHLMHYYSGMDDRFPALALLIKHWGIMAQINNAVDGTLSSYAMILMVIQYLQYGVLQVFQYGKPVLPVLQALFPNFFSPLTDVRALPLDKKLELPQHLRGTMDRDLTLAELLLGFFNYYANYFDFDTSVISIRTGSPLRRTGEHERKHIWIEEPFERTNVARAVCRKVNYDKIVQAFRSGYENLRRGKSLNSIGVTLL